MKEIQNIADSFPERLRRLRRERDWSQGQLAQKIGIDTQRISKYERGLSSPPLDLLVQIAGVLEVSLDYLLTGKANGATRLKNAKLIERIEQLEKLPGEYQETLISVLDSFIKRHKFEELAHQ
jgi:transcriptional regulator with XRE-family HTH domain